MWGSHHPHSLGDGESADQSNNSAGSAAHGTANQAAAAAAAAATNDQLAAISALAAFSQQTSVYPPNAAAANPFGYVDAGAAAMAAAVGYPTYQQAAYGHYHPAYAGDLSNYAASIAPGAAAHHALGQNQQPVGHEDPAAAMLLSGAVAPTAPEAPESDSDEEMQDVPATSLQHAETEAPRGKPEAMAVALAASKIESAQRELQEEEVPEAVAEAVAEPVQDEKEEEMAPPPKPKKQRKSPVKKKSPPPTLPLQRTELIFGEKVKPITSDEYSNLDVLMQQFCKVPLLAEFSRPVALLHPELMTAYSKIVSHPVDLGMVSRGIRKRQYLCTRDVRLDMWRVFANCVKFHSHPNNKEAVPSFVSIALHLKDYFNFLWYEYMMPSDLPTDASSTQKRAFGLRDSERQKRHRNSGVLNLSCPFAKTLTTMLVAFIDSGGRVDVLDKEDVFGLQAKIKHPDLDIVVANLRQCAMKLSSSPEGDDYSVSEFYDDLRKCYTNEVLEDDMALRNRIANRLNRFFWKNSIPLHEANTRGVTQSSIWGNIATTIWARESSKKPYWPALCLGILPPEDQRESWHAAVTECNESRLPEKLRMQLMAAKKKCEQGQKRVSLSYFLVEFCGTHEFIWVRETDIIEKFDPDNDPNKAPAVGPNKKKRASRSVTASAVNSKMYAAALEECAWANEEFEVVLAEAFGGKDEEQEAEGEEMNYSYSLLSQSDDEADTAVNRGYEFKTEDMSNSDVDEANWLLSHEGALEIPTKKKKPPPAKKKTPTKEKKETKKSKDTKRKKDAKAREREEKKEQRDLEKRRKRRQRERDRILRGDSRKKRRQDVDDDELFRDKRLRAAAIAQAYISRASQEDYKSLGLSGVTTLPAAMVESTGLLGVALAIRAAAGELDMPDSAPEDKNINKPWLNIDADAPKTSKERTEKIKEQIDLLRKQLELTKKNTEQRKELTAATNTEAKEFHTRVEADDTAVRLTYSKKKSSTPKKGSPKEAGTGSHGTSQPQSPDESIVANGSTGLSEEPAEPSHETIEDKEAPETIGPATMEVEASEPEKNPAEDN